MKTSPSNTVYNMLYNNATCMFTKNDKSNILYNMLYNNDYTNAQFIFV